MHLADDLLAKHFFISMCFPWELNPQPFALLTQYSTTEPQEHIILPTSVFAELQWSYSSILIRNHGFR